MSVGGDNYCYGEPNWIYTINKEIKAKNKKNIFWCTSLFEEIESAEMIRDLKTFDIIVARETLTYQALEKFVDKEFAFFRLQNAEKKQLHNFDFYGKLLYRYYKIQSKVMRKRHE